MTTDLFLASRIAVFLHDHPDDLMELGDATASAQHATSHGDTDAPAVHERDALLQQLADDLADALTGIPGQRGGRAA